MTVSLERPPQSRRRPSPRVRKHRTVPAAARRSTRDRVAWPIAVIIITAMVIMFAFALLEMVGVDVGPAIDVVVDLLEKLR